MHPETKKELVRKIPGRPPYLEFVPLQVPQLSHRFTLRGTQPESFPNPPPIPDDANHHVQAEQTHGNLVVSVDIRDHDSIIPQADGLVTNEKNLALIIRTADCGPVYFYDPVRRAIGLAHSGKKGTALNISEQIIRKMHEKFDSQARDLIVTLGPCIRPPDYDIDFAAEIGRQVQAAGVQHYYDCGLNTASNLGEFYSYRAELGKTGRHYAFLMLRD